MLSFFAYGFLLLSLALAYWFMIRPLLRARPAFADFYRASDSRWSAFWLKFDTIKTKLLALLLIIANGLISLHDFLIPLMTGVDWTPVTAKVPPIAWPFIAMGFSGLFFWLRSLTAKSQEQKFVAVEAGVITAQQASDGGDADAQVAAMAMKSPDED